MATKSFVTTIQMNKVDPAALQRLLAMKPGDVSEVCTVIGKIRGLSFRNDPNNDSGVSAALTGYFEAVPHDEAASIMIGDSIYFPPALQKALTSTVLKDTAPPKGPIKRGMSIDIDAGMELPVAVEISAIRDDGEGIEAGYKWQTKLVVDEMQKQDVLADLRAHVGNRGAVKDAPRIEAGARPAALPKPKGKGKK